MADSGDVLDTFEWSDYWTLLSENQTSTSALVSGSGRPSVLVFGGLLAVWGLCLHAVTLWVVSRPGPLAPGRRPPHCRLHGLVASLSAGQILMLMVVLPVELLTEARGRWLLGAAACRVWRPAHLGLVSLYMWGHLAVTVERYVRCLRHEPVGKPRAESRWVTAGVVAGVWVAAFTSTVIVSVVLEQTRALDPELCAIDLSPQTAFILAVSVFFVPAALLAAASCALMVARCRTKDSAVYFDHQTCTLTRNAAKTNEAFGSTTTMGRCSVTPERHYGAHALLLSTQQEPEVRHLGLSVRMALVANVIAVICWAPFYVSSVLVASCDGVCVLPALWTLMLWVGYASLGLGPIVWCFEPSIRAKAKAAIG